ncbi:MAG TPA: YihY/virulence factor BrkB family protein [Kofleriaceae bacterium]|nr:YihY/virulence factor BrkB family protein [Kofleriaceae bacterium]
MDVLKETGNDWIDDKAPRLAASLALYTLMSLAPLLILAVSVAGLMFGDDAARGQIAHQLSGVLGAKGALAIQDILANAKAPSSGVLGTVVGLALALFGASGVFGELQGTLNTIWDVDTKPGRGVMGFLRDRFFSFTLVLGVAFLLLVSLVLSAVLATVGAYFEHRLPGGSVMWQIVNFGVSFGVTTLLFAMIYKIVPDVTIQWRDVWIGALATAALFTLGKLGIALYVGRSTVASPFGAAGSLVALVVWVYYSAQILFFGAELTQVYARRRGARIEPTKNAVLVERRLEVVGAH